MSSWVRRASLVGVAAIATAIALEVPLSATQFVVPEIDAGSLSTGMALLAGGVLVLRARWSRK